MILASGQFLRVLKSSKSQGNFFLYITTTFSPFRTLLAVWDIFFKESVPKLFGKRLWSSWRSTAFKFVWCLGESIINVTQSVCETTRDHVKLSLQMKLDKVLSISVLNPLIFYRSILNTWTGLSQITQICCSKCGLNFLLISILTIRSFKTNSLNALRASIL